MVSQFKVCQNCGKKLGADSVWRKKFCSDKCRVQANRAKKATPKKVLEEKAEKFDRLVLSIRDSINRLEKHAQKAEELSHDMSKPLDKRLGFVAMFREKTAIANELKLLLEMNSEKDSWQEYLDNSDPITWD